MMFIDTYYWKSNTHMQSASEVGCFSFTLQNYLRTPIIKTSKIPIATGFFDCDLILRTEKLNHDFCVQKN